MSDNLEIQDTHRRRLAYVYIRQSSATQVLVNRESTQRQYQLTERAAQLGWSQEQIRVIDEDLAHTGSGVVTRHGFAQMTQQAALGQVGLVLCLEAAAMPPVKAAAPIAAAATNPAPDKPQGVVGQAQAA